MKFYVDGRHFSFLTEVQFGATAFRLRAETLKINMAFTLEDCDYIDEHLRGRGTIRELQLGTPTVDAIRFNKFLQDFHISELTVRDMPVEYFTQPNVQKLEKLEYDGDFPISLNYLSDSSTHSGRITVGRRTFDFDDLNLLLKKWAANEKVIKELKIRGLRGVKFDENKAFAGWRVMWRKERLPYERPLVLHDTHFRYCLLRSDGTSLYIAIVRGDLNLSISEYRYKPSDDEDSDYWYDSDYDDSYGGYSS